MLGIPHVSRGAYGKCDEPFSFDLRYDSKECLQPVKLFRPPGFNGARIRKKDEL
jgi:hypothetical protein